MASYSVARSKTATLVASTADAVTITGTYRTIQVVNFSASDRISCTFQGATATTDGDNTIPIPPGGTTTLYDDPGDTSSLVNPDADVVVSLISAGTPTYCVVAF